MNSLVEPLESRIAPTSMIPFTDIDGDLVTIRSSEGTLTVAMLDLSAPAGPAQLYSLTVTEPDFTNASITFTVSRVPGGDGRVNVGKMNAVGVDLFSVSVPGDLANLLVGNVDTDTTALRSLNVLSMGTFGLTTQRLSLSPTLNSIIMGDVLRIQVDNDVRDANLFVNSGGIGVLSILGQLDGERVVADEDIGSARIQDGIVGRDTSDSGSVLAHGSIGTVTLHGSITGGAGQRSGSIRSDHNLRTLNLDGTLLGGFGLDSGRVSAGDLLSFIKMHGDVTGAPERIPASSNRLTRCATYPSRARWRAAPVITADASRATSSGRSCRALRTCSSATCPEARAWRAARSSGAPRVARSAARSSAAAAKTAASPAASTATTK